MTMVDPKPCHSMTSDATWLYSWSDDTLSTLLGFDRYLRLSNDSFCLDRQRQYQECVPLISATPLIDPAMLHATIGSGGVGKGALWKADTPVPPANDRRIMGHSSDSSGLPGHGGSAVLLPISS